MIEDVLPEMQFTFIPLPANFHFAYLVFFALGPAPFWYIHAVVLHATFTLVDIFCKAATERINRKKRQ